jgi:hypothetical protein
MAVGADFDLQVVSQSRPRLERIAARAAHVDLFVIGVRVGFHGISQSGRVLPAGHKKKGAQSSGRKLASQAQIAAIPYPQKVWITLWVASSRRPKTAADIVKLLAWSNNDQDIKSLSFNGLQGVCLATELK